MSISNIYHNSTSKVTQILKIHGDFNNPDRIVISEEDYDTFLERTPLMSTYIANLLIIALLAMKHFTADLYDLLILDIVMPQIDGFALYERMKKIDNKVKVCFITGFDVNYQALREVFPTVSTTDEIGCFIRQPVEVQQLLKQVKGELQ